MKLRMCEKSRYYKDGSLEYQYKIQAKRWWLPFWRDIMLTGKSFCYHVFRYSSRDEAIEEMVMLEKNVKSKWKCTSCD